MINFCFHQKLCSYHVLFFFMFSRFNLNRHIRLVHSRQLRDKDVSAVPVSASNSLCVSYSERATLEQPNRSSNAIIRRAVSSESSTNVAHENQTRGFYLFLSNIEKNKPIASQSVRLMKPSNSLLNSLPKPALVADVQLIPCSPSNPEAQYGPCNRAWRKSVLVTNAVPTTSDH